MKREYRSINAVHESDLEGFLASVGLLQEFQDGKLKCKFCKDPIDKQNIYSIIKDSDTYKAVCSKAQCVSALMEFLEAKRRSQGVDHE
jgi:hypothetical protein